MKNILLFTVIILLNVAAIFSTDKIRCSTVETFKQNAVNHPEILTRKQQLENDILQWIAQNASGRQNGMEAIITVPVVIHVVYNTTEQNILDEQIQSQIDRLNKDFRNLNTDKLASSHAFFPLAGDAGIEFCIAKTTPSGDITTGITRTSTSTTQFSNNDDVKFTSHGGEDAWDATKYLNIWVCNLAGNLLGYAQYPGGAASTDGVVINYKNFGTTGVVVPPYDLGRTATHEIGHWLNLDHIWGDDELYPDKCITSDNVSDTPNQEIQTSGCPAAVVTDNCTTTAPGIMYQNYMDYTDDACMVMFTKGQITRMKAVFNVARAGILTSNKCSGTTGISLQVQHKLKIYPNPVQNYLTIEGLPKTKSKSYTVDIFNIIGEKIYSTQIPELDSMIEMSDFRTGTYVMTIYNDEFSITQKLTVVK